MLKSRKIRWLVVGVIILVLPIIISSVALPDKLFEEDYSTFVLDRNNKLIGIKLSSDQQYRIKADSNVSEKFAHCLITFEDSWFYYHPGINPVSIVSALIDNLKAGKIVRGGSTISMQVIRLSRKGKPRTIKEKLIEIFLSFGLEVRYSKDEILSMYAANAPFGGNIVGIDAASWKYFNRPPNNLSWAEAASLAVLPNSPSLIRPGKNEILFLKKRNFLLKKLLDNNTIDSTTYELSLLENLPDRAIKFQTNIPHLLEYFNQKFKGERILSTIDSHLQYIVNDVLIKQKNRLKESGIENAAVIIANPSTKQILAYAGNIPESKGKTEFYYNDMARAPRSSGSILKPFLYAALLDDGSIMPNSLVRDIPSYFDNFSPQNYNGSFQGSVPASLALSRSLNVPAVYMLQNYGIGRFINLLHKLNFKHINKSADYYGLSLILGGAEVSLLELVNAYSGMAKCLIDYDENYGEISNYNPYSQLDFFIKSKANESALERMNYIINPSSIWLTYNALRKVSRPESELGWEYFSSSQKIAWKTGTSNGFRDAWAVGTTASYIVGVWTGNADGSGKSGISGTKSAAPLLFDIFSKLNNKNSFETPWDELQEIEVCKQSGLPASRYCPETITELCGLKAENVGVCNYHKRIFTNSDYSKQVNLDCYTEDEIKSSTYFVLPPVQEYYYMKNHPSYRNLPPWDEDCLNGNNNNLIEIIYPVRANSVKLSRNEYGVYNKVVFEIKHQIPGTTVYWHLDNKMIGITTKDHKIAFIPEAGKHKLTVVDEQGNSKSIMVEVIE